ncbi:MAG: hypothetical protein DELT_02475 [Desulfovibrio sp.]
MRIFSVLAIVCCFFLAACTGSSDTDTLDVDKADSKQVAALADTTVISVGMTDSHVLQLLGPADTTDADGEGGQFWRYYGKRAEYVYASNQDGTPSMIIGEYNANPVIEPGQMPTGLPLIMTILFDPAKKVVNFTFSQIAF